MTSQHRNVSDAAAFAATIRALVFFISCSLFVLLLFPIDSGAAWDCAKAMHKQALGTAVEFVPDDMKNSIRIHKKPMYRSVAKVHESPDSLKPYEAMYKELVDMASKRDRRLYDDMAGGMADISMYIFTNLSPARLNDHCKDETVLKQASFMYDGYDRIPDYRSAKYNINDKKKSGKDIKIYVFYNDLVNEILDLWVSIWEAAGRDIRGLPEKYTLQPGSGNNSFLSFLPVETVLQLGKHSLDSQRPAEAAKAFEEVISINKNDKTALYGLGLANFRLQKYQDALKYFNMVGEHEDALYYVGLLAEMSGRDTALSGEKISLYSESFEAFKKYVATGGPMASNAQKRLGDVGESLLGLYEKRLSRELSAAGEVLGEAKESLSTFQLNEFNEILKEIRRKNKHYNSVARYLKEAGLSKLTAKNFSDSIKKLERRADSTRTAINKAISSKESEKAQASKEKKAPAKKEDKKEAKQSSGKKQDSQELKTGDNTPPPPVTAPESAAAAGNPGPAGVKDDVKARVRKYSEDEERKTLIKSFRQGYKGDSCAEVESSAFASYSKHGPKEEAEVWANMQKSSCLSGKQAKTTGLTYYQSLSDYLTSLPD